MTRAAPMFAMQPEMLSQPLSVRTHNPYALKLLPPSPAANAKSAPAGGPSGRHEATASGKCSCGRWECHAAATTAAAPAAAAVTMTAAAAESPIGAAPPPSPCMYLTAAYASAAAAPSPAPTARPVVVNFKFGSRVFTSAFRVSPGDAVVCEWDDGAKHIGLVAEVLSPQQMPFPASAQLPLVRRARDGDLAAFHSVRYREPTAVTECQRVLDKTSSGPCPCRVLDAEFLLDGSGVTLSLAFDGPGEQLDAIHDALAARLQCRIWLLTTSDILGLAVTA